MKTSKKKQKITLTDHMHGIFKVRVTSKLRLTIILHLSHCIEHSKLSNKQTETYHHSAFITLQEQIVFILLQTERSTQPNTLRTNNNDSKSEDTNDDIAKENNNLQAQDTESLGSS